MCKEEKVLPLPIIHKIFEGVLTLDDYKLNFGLCKALGNVLDDLGDFLLRVGNRNQADRMRHRHARARAAARTPAGSRAID